MEVFRSEQYYIFVRGSASLWWEKGTSNFSCRSAWDLSSLQDIECMGITQAIIGKIEHESVYEPRLMIVKECSPVGNLFDDHMIYKIKSICMLTSEDVELSLTPCSKHLTGSQKALDTKPIRREGAKSLFENSAFVNKTWGAVKSAGNTIKNTTQQAAAIATSQVKQSVNKRRDSKERDRLEKRITDELHKIFDDTDSFYFCKTADITNSLQRHQKIDVTLPGSLWKFADDRFFWNKHMLNDIINQEDPAFEAWIIPVIQGHVQVRQCEVDANECSPHLNTESLRGSASQCKEIFTLSLISRRSRYRAGTRYKRRGVDENGHVANYVETEQSLVHRSHRVSFVQVRGSAPVYWSQPGLKYRPPPRLDKGEQETVVAFNMHFDNELKLYGPTCIVNLVEQAGRERVIFDAYSQYVYLYNSPDIVYTTFDFHEYCRGMHFENVSVLINAITDIITDMGYCWRDPQGYICLQNGVFRVNCIDCLDRTNVVQTAIAKSVLEMQVTRLGLSGPDWPLPVSLRTTLHELWADNGDIISRQYAGTNALKGDYTRTGERKFTGIMKDGMNSANRYYIQHFVDAFRQCCLDLLLGNEISDDDLDQEMEVFSKLKTVGDITTRAIIPAVIELPISQAVPVYFQQTMREELLLLDLTYSLSSYYLSRFKDAFRQATIDLMLGEAEVSELTLQHESSESEDERQATADHVKQLIEDCKKLLVSEPNSVIGAWGLIDADPGTGDPHETEMDSILILTHNSYIVADYDDQSDQVTKYQEVLLSDITLIESGVIESTSQISLSNLKSNLSLVGNKNKPAENAMSIRFNYRIEGQDGYFHVFRSTNLRFFNNMAIYIKTPEEICESLRSICEGFIVTIVAAGLPKIPYNQLAKLERKKSKVRPDSRGNTRKALYLELAGLPSITRNLSETQLAIKSAGSKALTNMSEQFSKLNKFSRNRTEMPKPLKFDAVKTNKSVFTLGKTPIKNMIKKHTKGGHSDCTSSDNSSDDEEGKVNIFEPTLDNFEHCQQYVGNNPLMKSDSDAKTDQIVQLEGNSEAYLMENPLYSSKIEASEFIADVSHPEDLIQDLNIGESSVSNTHAAKPAVKLNPFNTDNELNFDNLHFDERFRSTTPEITIDFENSSSSWDQNSDGASNSFKAQPPSSLKLNQKLSHSSGEVDSNPNPNLMDNFEIKLDGDKGTDCTLPVRSNSQQEINLSISQSQSESALRQLKNITSPVASATKDLVLSPFSKFAKGMQSLGANLDPRKMKSGVIAKQITEQQYEEHRKLLEKWRKSNTRLIAL